MLDYQLLSVPDNSKRTGFKYCYVYHEPYQCIDARFINAGCKRHKALNSIRFAAYRLMAINANIGNTVAQEDICKYISNKIGFSLKANKISTVHYSDIKIIVSQCFNEDPPRWMKIISDKRVMWKQNSRELTALTDKEKREVAQMGTEEERLELEIKIKSSKKQKYAMSCLREVNEGQMLEMIQYGVVAIMETSDGEDLTYTSLARLLSSYYGSHIDPRTVKKYVGKLKGLINQLDIADNATLRKARDSEEKLFETCRLIHKNKELITKARLHKKSGVSRPTIDKKYKDDKVMLKNYVDELNGKLQSKKT